MDVLNIVWQLLQGIDETIIVTVSCFLTGTIMALLMVSLRHLGIPGLTRLVDTFTFIFRAVPVLVLIFLVYFGFPGIGLKIQPLLAMNLSLGLVAGAYLTEVFRGALLSIDSSELLAAEASGMSYLQRLFFIEFPQMLRFSYPGMVNEFTSTLKNSPFAYTIGISEITRQATALTATINHSMQIYLVLGILYFLIYRVCLFFMNSVEEKFSIQ
ncbi:MAG TPA: amino acid ABC transporter permease [Gammaproteobacteria bacterium]|nr:amino acid ABC transporter permease [Gammaproteobacteria bacterium]